ncbi:MAG TPA: hypothetical protein VEH62_09885 [Gemmatimonadales bacterium]|nr:hypothetical protein [Gemmatimonadales bacterium]
MNRRDFLRTGLAAAALPGGRIRAGRGRRAPSVVLVADPVDHVASSAPARWALAELSEALEGAGARVRTAERVADAEPADRCIVAAGAESPDVAAALARANVVMPDTAEALAQLETSVARRRALVACGADARGLVYALLDLADRVRTGTAPLAALAFPRPVVERPANAVRSVMRQFTSEALDTPWLHDRESWTRYLVMLAAHRFNRVHLAFGLGYDSLRGVTDSYLLFAYPFLVAVPGSDVRVTGLPDADRERNLETLRFVSDAAAARGLDFQLGIWMHGYQLVDSPQARWVIEGLTPDAHAAYCGAALEAVLRACPAISSVALRIHGESGIAEGSYDFWGSVFAGAARCGRPVELDLHAKGLDATMIERALATGRPVNVSPKYAAEHLGLPYHQAAIRELEMPVAGRRGAGLMTLSEGARSFTRYGYADFLRDDRDYSIRPRVFSGTQRLLAWGDPAWAAAYARSFGFCGMTGADLMEPLTCRGRRGTGQGTRLGYADGRLAPRWDWQKYDQWYRAWGRACYDPDTAAESFARAMGADERARHLHAALAHASRILPLVTTAYLPSAACDAYWPEIHWNQPIVEAAGQDPYFDTPAPHTMPNASPLDPQLFASAADCAATLLGSEGSPPSPADAGGPRADVPAPAGSRYDPPEVARRLEDMAGEAERELALAGPQVAPDRLRIATDVALLAGLGRFFADKLRSAVLFAIHERSGDRRALEEALGAYRRAREAWAASSDRARGVYQADLSASDRFSERGQWADRLAGIDADLAAMAQRLASAPAAADPRAASAVDAVLRPRARPGWACDHRPPAGFQRGRAVDLELAVAKPRVPASVRLWFRRVNQAERWTSVDMEARAGAWRATIPADRADSTYPLQYYFELRGGDGASQLHPGLGADLAGEPYYVLRAT